MMYIKKLRASFGRLNGSELHLEKGLNIIQASNESGKSTWSSFIKSILFGLSIDRDKIGFLSDKTKYAPWSGAAMEGSADIHINGQDITITRSSSGKSLFKNFSAVYTDTATPVSTLSSENSGELLTGVPRTVFERSAFVGQSAVPVSQTAELEKRISAIVSSGDEQVSFSKTEDKLKSWRRKLRFNKSGSLPESELKLSQLKNAIVLLESAEEQLADMRSSSQALKAQINKLEKELSVCKAAVSSEKLRAIREEIAITESNITVLQAELTKNGHEITKDDIAVIREKLSAAVTAKSIVDNKAAVCNAAANTVDDIKNKLSLNPLFKFSKEDVKSDLSVSENSNPNKALFVLILTAAIILSVVASYFVYRFFSIIPAAIVLGILICAIIFSAVLAHRNTPIGKLLRKYKFNDISEFNQTAREYISLHTQLDNAENELYYADQARQSAANVYKNAENWLFGVSSAVCLKRDVDEIRASTDEFEITVGKLEECRFSLKTLKRTYSMLAADTVYDDTEAAKRSEAEIQRELREKRAQLASVEERYNIALGKMHSVGDPVIIKSTINSLQEEIAQQTTEFNALTLALETLQSAEEEIQSRFCPVISQKAEEYMAKFTDGKYDKLVFSGDFTAMAKATNDSAAHTSLALSEGTTQQLYLALRLAICDTVLSRDINCPIILDDVFCSFDDNRMKNALEVLYDISKTRQVILFTCHNREAELLSCRPDVAVQRWS